MVLNTGISMEVLCRMSLVGRKQLFKKTMLDD